MEELTVEGMKITKDGKEDMEINMEVLQVEDMESTLEVLQQEDMESTMEELQVEDTESTLEEHIVMIFTPA